MINYDFYIGMVHDGTNHKTMISRTAQMFQVQNVHFLRESEKGKRGKIDQHLFEYFVLEHICVVGFVNNSGKQLSTLKICDGRYSTYLDYSINNDNNR